MDRARIRRADRSHTKGEIPVWQRAIPAHGVPEREKEIPRSQGEEEEEGASPEQRALPTHGVQGWGGSCPKPTTRRDPPSSVRTKRKASR